MQQHAPDLDQLLAAAVGEVGAPERGARRLLVGLEAAAAVEHERAMLVVRVRAAHQGRVVRRLVPARARLLVERRAVLVPAAVSGDARLGRRPARGPAARLALRELGRHGRVPTGPEPHVRIDLKLELLASPQEAAHVPRPTRPRRLGLGQPHLPHAAAEVLPEAVGLAGPGRAADVVHVDRGGAEPTRRGRGELNAPHLRQRRQRLAVREGAHGGVGGVALVALEDEADANLGRVGGLGEHGPQRRVHLAVGIPERSEELVVWEWW